MTTNILLTGATGFIGGTILNDLLKSYAADSVHAVVRSEEQQRQLVSKVGVHTIHLDLNDQDAVSKAILENQVDIVVHTAGSSLYKPLALTLISALGQRKQQTGKPVYFIHTSGATIAADKSGWQHGPVKDTDDVLGLYKQTPTPYPVRQVDEAVMESAAENSVTAYIVAPPLVYGIGSGKFKIISAQVPYIVKASIGDKVAHKFPSDGTWQAVHVADLSTFYTALLTTILSGTPPPAGFFFPSAHRLSWWELVERIAVALHARGLINSPGVKVWPDDETAAKSLGIPKEYLDIVFSSTTDTLFNKGDQVKWKPDWTKEEFFQSLGDEIDAVQNETSYWTVLESKE